MLSLPQAAPTKKPVPVHLRSMPTPMTDKKRVLASDMREPTTFSPEAKSRGTIRPGERIEVVRYHDVTLYDRMHRVGQINDRQHKAAERLGNMWTAAGLNPRVQSTIELVSEEFQETADIPGVPNQTHAADPDAPTAKDRYRKLMRHMPVGYAMRVEAMLLDQHPGVQWLSTLQLALDWTADVFGLEK